MSKIAEVDLPVCEDAEGQSSPTNEECNERPPNIQRWNVHGTLQQTHSGLGLLAHLLDVEKSLRERKIN